MVNNKNILKIFSVIIFLEITSFLGFKFPEIRQVAFILICLATLVLTIKDLRWGIFILFLELFIGSKGYLFYFDFHHFLFSIRIAIWGIVMAVWLFKSITNYELRTTNFKNKLFYCFIVLLFFIFSGVLNALIHHNALLNIYSDFNNWLYLLAIFPFLAIIKTKEDWQKILEIFIAATLWLGLETIVLFFIFSHDLPALSNVLYEWLRNTLIGEIAFVQYGFFRIFIQSQIYNLLGIFLLLPFIIGKAKSKKQTAFYFLLSAFYLTTVIVSLSRSFWLGLAGGLVFLGIYYLVKKDWHKFIKLVFYFFSAAVLSFVLVIGILRFPYPAPLSGASLELFKTRALQLSGEAAISSRWNLLPVIWDNIKQAPLFGFGWGKTITYHSLDPRVLENYPNGEYTTYAFEWGWLDIWLKIGLLGLISYLILVLALIKDCLKRQIKIFLGLGAGLASLMVAHGFTPYLNHPLGLGLLIIVLAATITMNQVEV